MKPFAKTEQKVLTVTIDENGDLTYLKTNEHDIFAELGEVVTRRASHVEPGPRYERWLFHTLRFLFGDKGRVSNWTRSWFTLWRVNTSPVGGPILRQKHIYPGLDGTSWGEQIHYWGIRQEAIDAEVKFLNDWFLKG